MLAHERSESARDNFGNSSTKSKIVPNAFRPFIGNHQGWFACVKSKKKKKKKKKTLYTDKQLLMMAYEMSENAQDNFGKFIHQFQPETKILIRKLKKDLNKII